MGDVSELRVGNAYVGMEQGVQGVDEVIFVSNLGHGPGSCEDGGA